MLHWYLVYYMFELGNYKEVVHFS